MDDRPRTVRESLRLDPAKLARARRILGTRTDRETIEQALDLVGFHDEVHQGVWRIAGSNSLRDVFADSPA